MQQQQQQLGGSFPDLAQMISGLNASMLSGSGGSGQNNMAGSTNGSSRGITSDQANSKSTGSLPKEILESTLSNIVSNS